MKKSTKWIAALIAIVAMGGVADAAFLTGGLPRIAAAGPNVYVVWSDTSSGPYQVYMKRSTDKGLTWKAKKSLSADLNSAIDQDLVVSGSSLFVVWVEALDTYRRIMFRISENRGATWQSPVQVAARLYSDGFAARPTIAVSGANIYLAWDEWKSSSSQIEFTKSTDNGRTWTNPRRSPKIQFGPCIRPLPPMARPFVFLGLNQFPAWATR